MARPGAPQLQRPHHYFLHGDKAKAAQWLPWALQKLHQQTKSAVFGSRWYRISSDIRVRIQYTKAQKVVEIWADTHPCLYLESGLLEHRGTAPLNENTYLPSIWHHTEYIEGVRAPNAPLGDLCIKEVQPNTLQGENRGEGDTKTGTGCPKEKDKTNRFDASTIGASRTFTSTRKIYCKDGDAIKDLKKTQVLLPSSYFSGRLRLFVQCIYGSPRRDYNSIVDLFPFLSPLAVDEENLYWGFQDNYGMYRTRDFRYMLIRVTTSGVFAKELLPDRAGAELRSWLRRKSSFLTAERLLHYESYLMSTLTPDKDHTWYLIADASRVSKAFAYGGPWEWGWHWNMSGSTAEVVCIRVKPGTAVATLTYQATHIRLNISETDSSGKDLTKILKVGVQVLEGPSDFGMRNGEDLIWRPERAEGGMIVFVPDPNGPFTLGPKPDCDVPMYVYYDYAQDEFRVVRFYREKVGEPWTRANYTTPPASNINLLWQCNTAACSYNESANVAREYAFYVPGVLEKGPATMLELETHVLNSAQGELIGVSHQSGCVNVGVIATLYCGTKIQPVESRIDTYDLTFGGDQVSWSGSLNAEIMLVIPHMSCDSVYLNKRSQWLGSGSCGKLLPTSFVRSKCTDYELTNCVQFQSGPNQLEIGWDNFTIGGEPGFIKSTAKDDGLYGTVTFSNIKYEWIDVKYFYDDQKLDVHFDRGFTGTVNTGSASNFYVTSCSSMSDEFLIAQGQSIKFSSTDLDGWSEWFDPALITNPVITQSVFGKHSVNGAFFADKAPNGQSGIIEAGFDHSKSGTSTAAYVGFG